MASKFGKPTQQTEVDFSEEDSNEDKFFRSGKDNSILKEAQVPDYLSCIDENTVNVVDADTMVFKVASSVEEDYIEVKHIKAGSVKEFNNVTAFRGAGRKPDSIDPKSWLGVQNLKLEAKGKKLMSRDDFEVTPKKRLKYENGVTIDEKTFENSEQVAHYFLEKWIEAVKIQTGVFKMKPVIGSGLNHRHDLPIPQRYKADREGSERPILLKDLREYLTEKHDALVINGGFEADEIVDSYGKKGYQDFLKTGKFSYIKSSPDKDACNKEGALFNYTKDFHFKYPQLWLIKSWEEDVGIIELVKDKISGTGLKHMAMQLILGDSSDGYGPRKYLPEEVRPNVRYGVTEFFKDFYTLETQKEVLQKVVDIYLEWFPEGISYVAWNEEQQHMSTLEYLELMFSCAYMVDNKKDNTNLTQYLDMFKVDYKKATNNNVATSQVSSDSEVVGKVILDVKTALSELQTLSGIKSGTKPVLMDTFKEINEKLADIQVKLNEVYE